MNDELLGGTQESLREVAERRNIESRADLCDLVDSLRCRGYAVYLDASCAATRGEVVTCVARFIESALALSGLPKPGRAYVRVSGSASSLLVEVIHLSFTAHDALRRNRSVPNALEALRQRTCSRDEWLSVDRGPRGQLRIATLIRAA
jgi:hypothetical protein